MQLRIFLASVTIAVTYGVPLAFAGPNLVTNGSFETTSPTKTVSTQFGTSSYGSGQFVSGWTGNNGYDLWFPNVTAALTQSAVGQWTSTGKEKLWQAAASRDGGAFVGLDGDPTNGIQGGISQAVSGFIVGQQYRLTFEWAAGQLQSRTGATTERFDVTLGGQTQSTSTVGLPSAGFSGWMSATMLFTATAANQTLRFLAQGTPVNYPPFLLLDGVTLTQVPEPAALLMAGAGLGGLFLARRRRAA